MFDIKIAIKVKILILSYLWVMLESKNSGGMLLDVYEQNVSVGFFAI